MGQSYHAYSQSNIQEGTTKSTSSLNFEIFCPQNLPIPTYQTHLTLNLPFNRALQNANPQAP